MKPYSFVIQSRSDPPGKPPYAISFPMEAGVGKSYATEEVLRDDLAFGGFSEKAIEAICALLSFDGRIEFRHQNLTLSAFARLTSAATDGLSTCDCQIGRDTDGL